MSTPRNTKKRSADNTEDSVEKRRKEDTQQDSVAPTNTNDNMDISQTSSSGITPPVSVHSPLTSTITVASAADIAGLAAASSSSSTTIMSSLSFSSSSSSSSSSITLVTDPKAEAKSDPIPEKWRWVRDLIDEAHLPTLGLPARWDSTSKSHMLQAFDPIENRTINIETGKVSKKVKSPVGFITSTKDQNPMPGTQAPAAVRYERYIEPCMNTH